MSKMWLQGPPPKDCREETALMISIILLLILFTEMVQRHSIALLEEELREQFEFEGKVAQNG
jgi:hypothetical protein